MVWVGMLKGICVVCKDDQGGSMVWIGDGRGGSVVWVGMVKGGLWCG